MSDAAKSVRNQDYFRENMFLRLRGSLNHGASIGFRSSRTLQDGSCTLKRDVDVRANVVFSEETAETVVFQDGIDVGGDAGKNDVSALTVRNFAKVLKIVDACAVNEGNAAHTNDANLRMVVHGSH